MRVRFARWLAGLFTAAGLGLAVVAVLLGGDVLVPVLVAGAALVVVGLAYFGAIPYFVVTDAGVRVPMVLGGGGNTPVDRRERLRMDGDRLVVQRSDGRRDRVPVYRWMAHPGDWHDLAGTLSA